jgi:hypothetical protein
MTMCPLPRETFGQSPSEAVERAAQEQVRPVLWEHLPVSPLPTDLFGHHTAVVGVEVIVVRP